MRVVYPRAGEKNRILYCMVNKDTYDIEGIKLNVKLGKNKTNNLTLDMPEDNKFKFKNECMFGNIYRHFHHDDEDDPKCLVIDARLTTAMRHYLMYTEQYYCLEKMIRNMTNMVPDSGEEDMDKLYYKLCHNSNVF